MHAAKYVPRLTLEDSLGEETTPVSFLVISAIQERGAAMHAWLQEERMVGVSAFAAVPIWLVVEGLMGLNRSANDRTVGPLS